MQNNTFSPIEDVDSIELREPKGPPEVGTKENKERANELFNEWREDDNTSE